MQRVKLAVATRVSAKDFHHKTATGRSLQQYQFPNLEVYLFPENKAGLPTVYNSVIRSAANDPSLLVFAHDDLHILDFYWVHRILHSLQYFKIVGVAGNKRRLPRQPSWFFLDDKFTRDTSDNMSGIVGHGTGFPPESLNTYGAVGQQVKLLDGLFLAAHSSTFTDNNLMFDERFGFHFYDLDICRQAEEKNITCGTLDLSLVHESGGDFGSESWRKGYATYLEKWGS